MDPRCPRKLVRSPDSHCHEGKKAVDLSRKAQHGGCPWFVADPGANYCFFRLMQEDEQPMSPLKISRLLMIDDDQIRRALVSARAKVPQLAESGAIDEDFSSSE